MKEEPIIVLPIKFDRIVLKNELESNWENSRAEVIRKTPSAIQWGANFVKTNKMIKHQNIS